MIDVPGLKISGPLGRGGTAEVAKAFSSELNRDVAIKHPLLENSESVAQFSVLARREHHLIGHLKFPGFVNVLKHSDNPSYLLLELCNGHSLDQLGKIENAEMLLVIISAVAANLEFLRLNRIVHGDLKPHNIFLPSDFPFYESDELFFAKISDFSLGRLETEPESARAGHGTVGYAAPEVSTQGKTSYKSDLFALGVIAYQLASGKHPFSDGETDPLKIESRLREETPPPLGKFRNDLPKEFTELVESLLAKDEHLRPKAGWDICETLAKCGCKYPFEKVIAPTYLIRNHNEFDKFVHQFLQVTEKQKKQLIDYTDSKPDCLRLLLSANFKKKNLRYSAGRFSFQSNLYWPSYLRRRPLLFFSKATFHQKREIVKAAIGGQTGALPPSPPGTAILLKCLLSPALIRRVSAKFAKRHESSGDFENASRLYLQSGNLEGAIKSVEKATSYIKDSQERASAIHLINRVVEFAGFLERDFETRQILMTKGDLQRTGGDLDSAARTYGQIVELYKNKTPDKLLAETYRDLGDIFKTKQKFDDGIKVLNRALDIYRNIKDEHGESGTLNAIGEIFRIATDLSKALKYMRQALAIQRRLGIVADAASSLNSMAIIYGTEGKLKRAITLLTISLKMKRTVDNQFEIARTLNNLGYATFLLGKPAEAALFLEESLTINRHLGSKKEILYNLWNLSEVSLKLADLGDCLNYLEEGLQLAKDLADKPHMGRYHLSFGNILRRLCRFSEAKSHFDEVSTLANEIDDEILKMNLEISRAELRFEIGDSKTAIILAENALQNAHTFKTQPEILGALNTLIKATGQNKYLKNARDLTADKHLRRDRLMVEINYIQFLIDADFILDAQNLVSSFGTQLLELPNDIEKPRILNVLAEYHIKRKDYNEARNILGETFSTSNNKGLLLDELNGTILHGNVAFGVGSYEQSYTKYKYALQICKQIVNSISDEADKRLFMNKSSVKFLVTEIKRLNEKIGLNKKAGVSTTPAPEVN